MHIVIVSLNSCEAFINLDFRGVFFTKIRDHAEIVETFHSFCEFHILIDLLCHSVSLSVQADCQPRWLCTKPEHR